MAKKIKICFVCPHAYSLFNQSTNYMFGGSEVRALLFGNGLTQFADYEISFAVIDHGQAPVEQYGEIDVYLDSYYKKTDNDKPFINFLKRLQHQVQVLLRRNTIKIEGRHIPIQRFNTYEEIDADIYCTFGVSNFSVALITFIQNIGKKALLFIGSDIDLIGTYSKHKSIGTGICNYRLRGANSLIITQNRKQKELLKQYLGIDSITIKNPIDLKTKLPHKSNDVCNKYVLWIGKSDLIKRPDLFLDIAKEFPYIRFLMIMNLSVNKIHERIMSTKSDNMTILEYVPYKDIERYFTMAFAFVNTSVFEGFPNTFLQAGKYGVPILSLEVDPMNFITEYDCGISAKGDINKILDGLNKILNKCDSTLKWSHNLQNYVKQNHRLEDKVLQLDQIFQQMSP